MVAHSKNYNFAYWFSEFLSDTLVWHYCPSCQEVSFCGIEDDILQKCKKGHLMVLMEYGELPLDPFDYDNVFVKAKCGVRESLRMHERRFEGSIHTFMPGRRSVNVYSSRG